MATMKVKPSHESQGAYVVIEERDFDPKVHTPYEAGNGSDDGVAKPRRRGRPPKAQEK